LIFDFFFHFGGMPLNGRLMPSDGKTSLCLWQGELKMVSEEVIEVYVQ
jgi:hypothetical protein